MLLFLFFLYVLSPLTPLGMVKGWGKITLGHQYGCHDVIWKKTKKTFFFSGIYSSTYRVPQSPAVADAPDASLGFYPHPETAKEQNNNKCQGNTEESVYDNVMPPSCKPASKNNEPIEITEKRFHTGSAQSKVLNNTQSFGRHCYENYPEQAMYINLQQIPVNGSLENNSDSEVSYYNLHWKQAYSMVGR